jgi:hypothetical protein
MWRAAITTPDGKTKFVGVCVRKTKNVDSWADEWVWSPGAERNLEADRWNRGLCRQELVGVVAANLG